jgi:hypothetical protein
LNGESTGLVTVEKLGGADTIDTLCVCAPYNSTNPGQSNFQLLNLGRRGREEITLGYPRLYRYGFDGQPFYWRGKCVSFQIKPKNCEEHIPVLRGNRQLPFLSVLFSIFSILDLPHFQV